MALIYALLARVVKGIAALGKVAIKLPKAAMKAFVRKVRRYWTLREKSFHRKNPWDTTGEILREQALASLGDASTGAYNAVKVVGNFAIRVCKEPGEDQSWEYLQACYDAGNDRPAWAPKVYWIGRVCDHMSAIVEYVPESADSCECNLDTLGYGDVIGAFRNGVRQRVEGFKEFFSTLCVDCFDLHSGNFRFRSDGSIVFTDPVC